MTASEMMESGKNNRLVEIIASIAAWFIPLIVYVNTLAPGVTAGDAGEFIVAVSRGSMPHAPGYPLYMALLKVWTMLPLNFGPDPLAFKCNLFSAVCMTVAIWLFYKLMRILTGSASASLGAAMMLMVSRTLWKFAVVTEVYAFHILLVMLVLYGIAVARESRCGTGLVIASLGFGLGLAHHQSILLLIPLMIVLWPKGKNAPATPKALIVAGFILPLLFFLFLPVMASKTSPWNEPGYKFTSTDFVRIILRSETAEKADAYAETGEPLVGSQDILERIFWYGPKQFGLDPEALGSTESRGLKLKYMLLKLLGLFWPLLAFVGYLLAPRGKRIWPLMALISGFLWVIAYAFFSKGAPLGMPFNFLRAADEMMIPLNVFICMGFGWIFTPIVEYLKNSKDFEGTEGTNIIMTEHAPLVMLFLVCVIPVFIGFHNAKWSNMTHHTFTQDQSRNVLEQMASNGVLVVSGDESFVYEYMQKARGIRSDVDLLVYPFWQIASDGENEYMLSPEQSLAHFINFELWDNPMAFSFSPPADVLTMLNEPRSLRLDGVALTLIDRETEMDEFLIGNPGIWLQYQLRNLDPLTLSRTYPDDFEYETFERYINGLNASVALLENAGFGADPSREALALMALALRRSLKKTDYPFPPEQ